MGTMIQIRNVPTRLHRRLKAKAALSGQSLSSYLLAEIERLAEKPTTEELLQRLHQRAPVTPSVPPAEAIRAERDAR
jgi:plasmid stability protein